MGRVGKKGNSQKGADKKWSFHHSIMGSIVFTSIYFMLIFLFQWMDVWNGHYNKAGLIYVVYHFLRCLFIIYFAGAVCSIGYVLMSYILRNRNVESLGSLDFFLIASFLGASILTLLMFVLGLLKLNYLLATLLVTAPAVFISYPHLKQIVINMPVFLSHFSDEHFENRGAFNGIVAALLIFAIAIQISYLFIAKGLMPDLITNDTVTAYLPYYQEVINTHSIWMNKYFAFFYYCKAAGLFFLASLLTDIQSTQLVSFYFLLLIVLVLTALIKRMTNNNLLWVLLAVSVFLSASMITVETGLIVTEFQKPHVVMGAFVVFMTYLTVLLFSIPHELERAIIAIQLLIISAVIVMVPVSFSVILPYLILQVILLFLFKRALLCRFAIYSTLIASAVFVSMILFNYFSSGLFEGTPLPWFFEHRNESILRRWISPDAILFNIQWMTTSGEGAGAVGLRNILNIEKLINGIWFVLYDDSMLPAAVYLALFISMTTILVVGIKKKLLPINILFNILPIIIMLFFTSVLFTVVEQHSLFRFSFFVVYFRSVFYIFLLVFSISLIPHSGNIKRNIIIASVFVVFCFSSSNFIRLASGSQMPKYGFISGERSYADLYNLRWEATNVGLQIQKLIGRDKKVIVLNFSPGFYGLPKSSFQGPVAHDYSAYGDFETVLFGPPEKAAEVLKRNDINYVLIILDRELFFTAYAPLFDPSTLPRFFKIAATGENMLLLTWRSPTDEPIDNRIISGYEKARETYRTYTFAKTYENMKQIYLSRQKSMQ